MALNIKHRKKDNHYRAWTTIADGWLTDWITRESMVKYLQSRVMERAKKECEEISFTFPDGYWSKDGKRFNDEKRREIYHKLLQKRFGQ